MAEAGEPNPPYCSGFRSSKQRPGSLFLTRTKIGSWNIKRASLWRIGKNRYGCVLGANHWAISEHHSPASPTHCLLLSGTRLRRIGPPSGSSLHILSHAHKTDFPDMEWRMSVVLHYPPCQLVVLMSSKTRLGTSSLDAFTALRHLRWYEVREHMDGC
jgi:hypothetical protein